MIKIIYLNRKELYVDPVDHVRWIMENAPEAVISKYLEEIEDFRRQLRKQTNLVVQVNKKIKEQKKKKRKRNKPKDVNNG